MNKAQKYENTKGCLSLLVSVFFINLFCGEYF